MMKKLILCSITIGLCIGVMSGCGKSMTDKLEESSKQVEQQVNEKGKSEQETSSFSSKGRDTGEKIYDEYQGRYYVDSDRFHGRDEELKMEVDAIEEMLYFTIKLGDISFDEKTREISYDVILTNIDSKASYYSMDTFGLMNRYDDNSVWEAQFGRAEITVEGREYNEDETYLIESQETVTINYQFTMDEEDVYDLYFYCGYGWGLHQSMSAEEHHNNQNHVQFLSLNIAPKNRAFARAVEADGMND